MTRAIVCAPYAADHREALLAATTEMFDAGEEYPTPDQRALGVEGYLDLDDTKTLARYVALDGDRVIGHLAMSMPVWEPLQRALAGYSHYYEVSRLFTVPDSRRRGVSRELLRYALMRADAYNVAVGLSYFPRVSPGAAAVYAAEGFLPLGKPGDFEAMESPKEPVQVMLRPVRPAGSVLGWVGA